MKVVIVGGVAGGAGTATRLRRNDESAEILVLEKDEYISYAACGLPYVIGDVVSDVSRVIQQTPQGLKKRYNIDVRISSEVLSVDTAEKKLNVMNEKNGEAYDESYDVLVLSPGALPVVPPIPGIDLPHVHTLRSVRDALKIMEYIHSSPVKNAVVVGAGFIGLETAENLVCHSISVSIVDTAPHIIPLMDEDCVWELQNHVRGKGVGLFLGVSVKRITPESVELSDGTVLPADFVLVSTGTRPNTDFLRGSPIELDEKGSIKTDRYMRTNIPDIYAVGDAVVTESPISGKLSSVRLAQPADRQARVAADCIAGKTAEYKGSYNTAIIKVFDYSAGMTGVTETFLKKSETDYLKCYTLSSSHAAYYPGSGPVSVKLLFDRGGYILGAQITGSDSVDKVTDIFAAAIYMHCTVSDLADLEHAYSPPYSSVKDSVNIAGFAAENVLSDDKSFFYVEDINEIPEDAFVLDIRTHQEYMWGHLDGAVNVPLDELRESIDSFDKSKVIYLYCQTGARISIASRLLVQNGFSVRSLSGGYRMYQAMKANCEIKTLSVSKNI